jgi:hypothetical protein
MTEAEWLAWADPAPMLEFLRPNEETRKSRLFECACCRRIWRLIDDNRSRAALEGTERLVDGLATPGEANAAEVAAETAYKEKDWHRSTDKRGYAVGTALGVVLSTVTNRGLIAVGVARQAAVAVGVEAEIPIAESVEIDGITLWTGNRAVFEAHRTAEHAAQCTLLRDIFGNPFRPVAVDPTWLTWNDGMLVKVAHGIYDDCAFDRLPVLADALEDAGCDNEEILSHCRSKGPHVRGCWVVDLILAKE